jgi:uncharacterized membrane protein
MTPIVLASAYLGGAYFFVRVLSERHWNAIQAGFVSVTVFATLLGVATAIHWNKFNHRHVTFWIWAALYFTTSFLVGGAWLANQQVASSPLLRSFALARWFSGLSG